MDWTLRGLVERSLESNAPLTALRCDGVELTYAELDELSFVAAGQLAAAGVRRGDRVALLVANGLEYPIYDLAVLRLGGVKVPLNDMLAAGDVGFALEHSGARAIIVSESLSALADAALAGLEQPPATVPVSSVRALGEGRPGTFRDVELSGDDLAAIYYTGGTTGKPKAIVHSQRGLATNVFSTVIEAEIRREERLLVSTPLPHAAGLFTLVGLIRGASVTIERRFEVEAVMAAIERHAITWTFMVPTMLYRLLDSEAIGRHDHSTLRTILYGAAPIRADRLAAAMETFGPVFIQLYGQTEVPNFATTLSKGDHVAAAEQPDLLTSCGRAVLMAEVSIRDERGAYVAPGEVGEVCVRAPYTMVGYLDDPSAAATRFHGSWLRTGDIATMDTAGYVYLKDRRNDMVISGGMNVYTTVVERAIAECPGVSQVAVIGVPDPDWGEAVHAVVAADTAAVSEREVREHSSGQLAKYMRPKTIEIVPELPLTPYGKVDKKALRARHWSDGERQIG